ncbi:hypothetical protein Tsubulata_014591 [Turnera subulata]|uniref:BSD domain-containing protein n=1 Tax=Turnera subulata TaxID=218843 RepID=A0A9Q0JLW0_9ROSI|nr:hypothetical protein Tsubulata_014591 [Turnera subulata]
MNFFKSVFSEESTPPDSPKSPSPSGSPDPDSPETQTQPAWFLGGLIQTLATKSESVIETYRKDLEEFGSGLRKETSVIRDVASRAITDLPTSLEAGASVAQESLETVGQAIDDIGATVWKSTARIISHGRESISAAAAANHDQGGRRFDGYGNSSGRYESSPVRYNRFEMQVRAVQGDKETYCKEPEDREEYEKWRSGFVLQEKTEEIDGLIKENRVVSEIYSEVVPSEIDNAGFWSRYFYRMHKLKQAEEARALLVKRAISGEEEEDLSWDFDDEAEVGESSGKAEEEVEKRVSVGESNEGNVAEKVKIEALGDGNGGKVEGESSESCKDSDVSVVSKPEEEDLGWDEIEEVGGSNEERRKEEGAGTGRVVDDLRKRLNVAAEEEEDLSWDIEDDDDVVPVKN